MYLFFCQLAEKRKTILDEMAIKGQESATEQQKKLDELEERHKVRTYVRVTESSLYTLIKHTFISGF